MYNGREWPTVTDEGVPPSLRQRPGDKCPQEYHICFALLVKRLFLIKNEYPHTSDVDVNVRDDIGELVKLLEGVESLDSPSHDWSTT